VEPKGPGLDAKLEVWSRRKWLAILAFALPMSAAAGLISFLPNIYRSTATVLVDRQQIPETFVQSTVTSALETRLQTIRQDVLSRARLEALIHRFDLYRDLRLRVPLEDIIERSRRDIKLEIKSVEARGRGEATISFALSYQGTDPETVSQVTNALASFFIAEDSKARARQAAGTAEFLKVQLDETKKRLDEQEQQVSAFKRRHLGELPQQMDTNLAAIERLQTQLRVNADSQTRAVERRVALSRQIAEIESLLAAAPAAPGISPALSWAAPDSPEARLLRAREELARLRTQFTDKHPDVGRQAAEVGRLELEVEAATRDRARAPTSEGAKSQEAAGSRLQGPLAPYALRLREALSEVDTDIKVLKSEETRVRESIATYQSRVDRVPRREQEFIELSRDYDNTRELYKSLLKRRDEALLAENMEQRQKGEQFRILDPAVPSREPAAPPRLKLFFAALVGSIGLAIAATVAAERIDTSFHSVDELRLVGGAVPVLVSIPWVTTPTHVRRKRWRLRLGASAAVITLIVVFSLSYLVAHGNERLVAFVTRSGGL
jgi:polysaccharide chain length determinant protein (PEP-CTERM system associated)